MKLSPTEIFKGKKIFFIGGTMWSADTPVRMSAKHERKRRSPSDPIIIQDSIGKALVAARGDADKSVRAPF